MQRQRTAPFWRPRPTAARRVPRPLVIGGRGLTAGGLVTAALMTSAATVGAVMTGCASTPSVDTSGVVVTAADQGRVVRVATGDRLTVELVGNPSTGRAWELRALPDAAVLVPDGTRWVAMDGADGSDLARMQQLRFVAQGPGRALLVFEYVVPARPSSDASSFSVEVEVSSP